MFHERESNTFIDNLREILEAENSIELLRITRDRKKWKSMAANASEQGILCVTRSLKMKL